MPNASAPGQDRPAGSALRRARHHGVDVGIEHMLSAPPLRPDRDAQQRREAEHRVQMPAPP